MKRFQIIIKNLKEGKEIVNKETNCIFGSFDNDKGTGNMAFSDTNGLTIMATLTGLIATYKEVCKSLPGFAVETLKNVLKKEIIDE